MTTEDKLADLQRLSYDAGYQAGLEAAKMREAFNEGAVRMASSVTRGHYTIEPNVLNELWRDSSAARRLDALIREAEGDDA